MRLLKCAPLRIGTPALFLLTGIHPSMEAIKTGESLEDKQQRESLEDMQQREAAAAKCKVK
jgi:hypothetical protein